MPFLIGILKSVATWVIPYVVQEVVKDYFEARKKKSEETVEIKKEDEKKKEG